MKKILKLASELDTKWQNIGCFPDADLSQYNKSTGIYKLRIDDEIVYIGQAKEAANGGLRKRLRDFERRSKSARDYAAGEQINKKSRHIAIEILIIDDVEYINELKKYFIAEYNPSWNRIFKSSETNDYWKYFRTKR